MRKVHGRTKRHHCLRTHLCGAKVFKLRKLKKIRKMTAKKGEEAGNAGRK